MQTKSVKKFTGKIDAIHDHVLVDRARPVEVSPGGIIIPDAHKRRQRPPCYGVVVAIGPKVEEIKVGSVVLFNDQESATVEFGEVSLLALREFCVYASMTVEEARKQKLRIEE